MSVWTSGTKRGEMTFDVSKIDKTARKALEANLRQRGYTVMQNSSPLIVKVDVGSLRGNAIVAKLEEIHLSIKQTIDHKVAQQAAAVTT